MKIRTYLITGLMPLLVACGGRSSSEPEKEEIIVSVGDSTLTKSRMDGLIPSGLPEDDSVRMVKSIAGHWVRNQVLYDLGRRNLPDYEEIERLVDSYRNELIVERYLMALERNVPEISEREVKQYYAAHRDELRLKAPIVKGILLKVDDGDTNMENLRRWMSRADEASVDKIEKHGLRAATQYEYFLNRWIDWERVAAQIPYRFFDAQAFVETTRDFETSYGGSVYLLHISEYVGAGEEMPYDYARDHIRRMLGISVLKRDREAVVRRILRDAYEEGTLRPGSYNPLTGAVAGEREKMKSSPNK